MNADVVLKALEVVIDPELRRSIVELEMVRSIDISENGVVNVTVSLTTAGCPIRGHFQTSVAEAVSALEGVTHVNVYFDVLSDSEKASLQQKLGRGSLPAGSLAQVSNVLCIGSGKGGVGKSTLTANLAAALVADGKRVGILDADVWGYSIPRMYGLGATRPPVSPQRKIVPLESHGVKVMSIGFFLEEDAAVVWRGPMLHKALGQFLQDVEWGVLDYLLIDLPPGTGDVSMTLAQMLPQAQFVIVAAPSNSPEGRTPLSRDGQQGVFGDLRRDREHVGLYHAKRRALPDLRRGRRQGVGRRARCALARQGASYYAVASPGRQRLAAGDRGPRRPSLASDPSGSTWPDRDGADGATNTAAGRSGSAEPTNATGEPEARRHVFADVLAGCKGKKHGSGLSFSVDTVQIKAMDSMAAAQRRKDSELLKKANGRPGYNAAPGPYRRPDPGRLAPLRHPAWQYQGADPGHRFYKRPIQDKCQCGERLAAWGVNR